MLAKIICIVKNYTLKRNNRPFTPTDISSIDTSRITSELYRALFPDGKFICIYCGNDTYEAGPSGGVAQNIRCSNDACHKHYNIVQFPSGGGGAEEI